MAITYINTGIIANDGTGDDLREAFTKINNNFEELDLRIVEETIIENNGSLGEGLYSGKIDGIHRFKRLVAGTNVTLTQTANAVTINSTDAIDQLIIVTDDGTVTVSKDQSMSIRGGAGLTARANGTQVTVELDQAGIVSRDLTPSLSGNLSANSFNINGVGTIQATVFDGALEGLVYGYDVREFGPYLSGFDFGTIRNTYNNALEFIIANADLDFGAITPESGDTVDLGLIVV